MSSESILLAFQSAFPTLYTEPEDGSAEGSAALGDAVHAEGTAPAPEPSIDGSEQRQSLGASGRPSTAAGDPYSQKIERISNKFNKTRVSADELETYLRSKEQEAKEAEARALAKADEEFTQAWRETGLPMKPSHLQLDAGKMLGARLVDPKSIMGQYQALKTKEVLQPPHIYEYNDTSIQANYLKTTKNLQNRQSMLLPETLERAKELSLKTRTWHMLDEAEVKKKVAESEERRRVQDLKMPATQYDLEKKIIKSMHHKLSFLRNPRYPLPPAVKMLQTQFQQGPRWNVTDMASVTPPIKSNMTSRPDALFVVEPEVVVFTDYEVGGVYTQKVRIRNVTSVIRSLRVLPPASQYFHMSLPRFPMEQGIVAPGMHAEVTLRFCPDSLADYDDEFAVDTAGARFAVALQARRPPPSLTLPHELQLGDVLVGNRKGAQFNFSNLGGQGCFRVIPAGLWPERYAEAPTDVARVGPFELWPLYLDMAPGDQATINVGFEPQEMGTHEERFVLVCDNCQVQDFIVSGVACSVDIVLESIDEKPVRPGQLDAALWFGEVVPGSGFTKRLTMRNTTSLPFPFKWHQAMYPQTRPARTANDTTGPLTLGATGGAGALSAATGRSDISGVPDGGLDATRGPLPGSGGYGKVDLVDLGLEGNSAFVVTPSEGVLYAGESMVYEITFRPAASNCRYERYLQMRVDKTAQGQAPQGYHVTLLEVGLEGLGAPLVMDAAPRILQLPGTLTTGSATSGSVTLRNPSRAPAHFSVEVLPPASGAAVAPVTSAVSVSPSSGTVDALSELQLRVTFSALQGLLGSQEASLLVHVDHGESIPVQVKAHVSSPGVHLATTSLDFGLVRLKSSATLPIVIRNTSSTAPCQWSIHEYTEAALAAAAVAAGAEGMEGAEAGPGAVAAQLYAAARGEGSGAGAWTGMAGEGDGTRTPPHRAGAGMAAGAEVDAWRSLPASVLRSPLPMGSFRARCQSYAPSPLRPGQAASAPSAGRTLDPHGGADGMPGFSGASSGPTGAGHGSVGAGMGVVGPGGFASAFAAGPPRTPPPGSGSGAPPATVVVFEPSGGVLGPGEEQTINATLYANSDGQHRSIVQVLGPDGQVSCLEAFAAVVTPRATLSTPRLDLGTTFLGVTVKQTVAIKNLSLLPLDYRFSVDSPNEDPLADLRIKPDHGTLEPGESQELQLRYNPRALGDSVVLGVCDIEGAPQPTGFVVTSTIRGLLATYELFTPEQYEQYERLQAERAAGRVRRRRDDVDHFIGMTHLPPDVQAKYGLNKQGAKAAANRHLVADFGTAVPLGETRHMYLIVTNRTPIHTAIRTWLDDFGVEDVSRLTEKGRFGSPGAGTRDVASPGASGTAAGASGTGVGSGSNPARVRISKYTPIKLSDTADKLAPYRTATGNDMLAARRLQQEAEQVLGDKGLAVSVTPPESTLESWGRLVLQVSCFNDMCGDYFDMLHVRVGEMPPKDIPVRVGVAGTPLVVQKERVLIKGLRGRQWRTSLGFGQLPLGVPQDKSFFVFNTGGLDMRLTWGFMRFQDDSDCGRPEAKIFDVLLQSLETRTGGFKRGPGSEAASETRPSSAFGQAALDGHGAQRSTSGDGSGPGPRSGSGAGSVSGAGAGAGREQSTSGVAGESAAGPGTESGQGAPGAEPGAAGEGPSVSQAGTPGAGASAVGGALPGQPEEVAGPGPDGGAGPVPSAEQSGAGEGEEEEGDAPRLLKLVLDRHAEEDVVPFVVEPADKIIKGGEFAKFTVKFLSNRAAHHTGYLVGTQQVFSPEQPISLKVWTAGDNADSVGMLVSGTFHPYAGSPPTPLQPLQVDLSATAIAARLEPDENTDLEWVCQSTHDPLSHASYKRVVTMSNLQTCPLLFSMRTEGPFELLAVTPSAPQDPIAYQGIAGTPPSFGDRTYLPPNQSVDVSIRFKSSSAAEAAALSAAAAAEGRQLLSHSSFSRGSSTARTHTSAKKRAQSGSGSPLDNQDDFSLQGQLLVTYANGDVQTLPLHGQVLHPALQVKPASLAFGRVHVQAPKPLELVLSNPTLVDARWSVALASGGKPSQSGAGASKVSGSGSRSKGDAEAAAAAAAAAANAEEGVVAEARFGPFIVSPGGGLLHGRGLGLPRKQKVTVTYAPTDASEHSQSLRFVVHSGRSCTLELSGTGSFEEIEEHQALLKYKI